MLDHILKGENIAELNYFYRNSDILNQLEVREDIFSVSWQEHVGCITSHRYEGQKYGVWE